jgi:hypothetical protein
VPAGIGRVSVCEAVLLLVTDTELTAVGWNMPLAFEISTVNVLVAE